MKRANASARLQLPDGFEDALERLPKEAEAEETRTQRDTGAVRPIAQRGPMKRERPALALAAEPQGARPADAPAAERATTTRRARVPGSNQVSFADLIEAIERDEERLDSATETN